MEDTGTSLAKARETNDGAKLLSKIRGKFKVRSMANTWRQRANNRALPSLTPFIPYILRDELLEVAKWWVFCTSYSVRSAAHFCRGVRIQSAEVQPCRYTRNNLSSSTCFGSHRLLYEGKRALVPSLVESRGAVMVADVTGFTQLTEVLSKKGSTGVELLINCINSYFGKVVECLHHSAPNRDRDRLHISVNGVQVIDVIHAHGGDVIKFAGDAMIVVFCPAQHEFTLKGDQGFRNAVFRCALCSYEVRARNPV